MKFLWHLKSLVIVSLKRSMRTDSLIGASKAGNICLMVVVNLKPAEHNDAENKSFIERQKQHIIRKTR